ncbi:MAG: alanine racemase [Rhizomicrobium sp.]
MNDGPFEAAGLTVRLGAIAANYKEFRRISGRVPVAGVVKADAYGLGAEFVAPALHAAGCDTFFVARLEEGVALRKVMGDARIFVLDGAPGQALPALVSHRLTPVLNSLEDISNWNGVGSFPAAIHIDTGMNRLGLSPDELSLLAKEWRVRLEKIGPILWMSHLASGDAKKSRMNHVQLARFRAALAMLPPAPASLAASGGAFLGPAYRFDLVRPGIGLYGGAPQEGGQAMRTAAVLSARVLQLRRIDRQESVGYAATFRAKRPTMLATVALGYAGGLPRSLSNKGFAHVGGARAPYAGRVSMDMTVLDVTDIPGVALHGTVELLGDQVGLEDIAHLAGTNAYEILTGLKASRHYVDAG